jgi:hypothetical protein
MEKITKALTTETLLAFFKKGAPTTVFVDGGPAATGAVLLQKQNSGTQVIEYASKALSDVECRYSQIEKEAISLVHGCERFKYYLIGGPKFTLVTDHKPLIFLWDKQMKYGARIERWILRLQEFDFTLVHT